MRSLSKTKDYVIKLRLREWYAFALCLEDNEVEDALNWYAQARTFARNLAAQFNLDVYTVAGVISALSPNNKWERNKIDALYLIEAFKKGESLDAVKVCTYGANKRKAVEILKGDYDIPTESPKTHAFCMNIAYNSPKHLTIDKWMIRACLHTVNEVTNKKNIDYTLSMGDAQYRRIEALFNEVFKDIGLPMYKIQALIWVYIRQIY